MDFLTTAPDVAVEKEVDRLGGFRIYDADVYVAVIKAAFLDVSSGGANNVTVLLENADGMKYTHVEYITSKPRLDPLNTTNGTEAIARNYYYDKKTGAKKAMPGMQKMSSLSELLTGNVLSASVIEDRVHKLYSKEAQGDTNQTRKTLIDWTGKVVHVGMLKLIENKRELVGEKYIAVAETRESNDIDKWFNSDSQTLAEFQAGSPAKFYIDWAKQNGGKVRDKTDKKLAQSGAPAAAGGGAAPLNFT